MSKILEKALQRAKTLPDNRQDEIGEMILSVVDQDESTMQLTPSQQEEVKRRMAEPNPIVATNEQIEAFFRKFAV